MTQNTNPLADFYRNPKIYVALPSGTDYYSAEVVEMPEVGELPVYPMTAKDDLLTKNPDALLNGDAVIRLVKSCVPAVKKPAELLAPDMEALLIAIRKASSGEELMDVTRNCPECDAENKFDLDLSIVLANAQEIEAVKEVTLSNGLIASISPTNYIHTVQSAKTVIEQNRNFQNIDPKQSDEQLKALGEALEKLSTMNYQVILESINSITIPNGATVTDSVQISEFLENVEKEIGIELNDAVSDINNGGVEKELDMQCSECENVYKTTINFDPVGFFLNS
tara:strand:- start:1049 stop:1891 length:843 start_codon:yes stop_codon:yes gene_type:complete